MWCEIDAKKSFNRLIWGVTIAYKPEPKEYGLAYKWVKQLQNNLFLSWPYLPYDRSYVDTLFLLPLEMLWHSSKWRRFSNPQHTLKIKKRNKHSSHQLRFYKMAIKRKTTIFSIIPSRFHFLWKILP